MSKINLKEAFEIECKHGAFYTGGNIQWSKNAENLFCQKGGTVSVLSLNKGSVISSLGLTEADQEKDTINCFTLCNEDTSIITHHKSGLFKLWNLKTSTITKLWKSIHKGPVIRITLSNNNILMASGGSDSTVRLWNLQHHACIHSLKGIQGVISVLEFHPNKENKHPLLFGAGDNTKIYGWNISTGQEKIILSGHFSTVTSLNFHENENYLISSLVPAAKEEGGLSITHLLYNSIHNIFAVVSVDHNIIIHSLELFECKKQLVGYSDEILDIVYLGNSDSHIALATNSSDIKLYEIVSMNCQLVCGHTDSVLALATTPANVNLLVSSSKDNSVRVWLLDKETTRMFCIGYAVRHTASISSVAISQITTKFFTTVAQDSCLKLWELPNNLESYNQVLSLNVSHTILAHQKEMNCVTISPNDKLIATASQDKTAKLWSTETLQLLGVFHGHRRGVWCVRFSPIDQVLLTTSADCTMKLWSLTDLNCLKTFEGHESSVLRGEFLSRGMQLITSGGDGLLKLWNIKTSECVTTLNQHESHVWTLAVTKDQKNIISGGSDSLLVFWRDVTEERKTREALEKAQLALEEQKLANLLKAEELQAALQLALKLERPLQVLKIVEAILKKQNKFVEIIKELKPIRKEALLRCAVTWNTNSRNSHAAQMVINTLITELETQELQMSNLSSTLETTIPYTDRHFKRLTKLLQDLHLLTYTFNRMKPDISIDTK
ncbi:transducin beta-like protein 3 [Pogonomyrmex barbatus]|uniref:Transducin beta-like protein 3 n=1 Tax=Pogonomyrmex barbatus TaxID=144034 RepID=A0A6I9W9R6_9HYME|nr:transducin beta-like protein 3 [Pogonomyrmex barbatus]